MSTGERVHRVALAVLGRREDHVEVMKDRGMLRAVGSAVRCNTEMRISGDIVLCVCELPAGHDGKHKDGCTRW